ncbi:hypothetical protein [Leptothermofonsia sp. ETS-13]|uniref:hypothetical protein n=1 Tax=Leptothermofonsia sp. ETS-13 TaxID=3035696 RepID=UPI003B9DCF3E
MDAWVLKTFVIPIETILTVDALEEARSRKPGARSRIYSDSWLRLFKALSGAFEAQTAITFIAD